MPTPVPHLSLPPLFLNTELLVWSENRRSTVLNWDRRVTRVAKFP